MKITSIFLELSIFFNISIAFYAYIRNKERRANLLFGIFCLNLALWALIVIFILYSKDFSTAEFWIRIAFLVGAFLPSNFYLFQKKLGSFDPPLTKKDILKINLSYLISIILSALCFSKLFLRKVEYYGWEENPYYTAPEAKYGPLFPFYIITVLYVMFISLYELKKKQDRSEGIFKTEIQYVFFAVLVGTIYVAFTNLFAPYLWHTTLISQFAPFSSTLMISIIGYGIAKYRILSLKDFIERTWIYFLTFLAIGCIYFSFWFLFLSIFKFISPLASSISVLFSAFFSILLFFPVRNLIREKIVSSKSSSKLMEKTETEFFYSLTKVASFKEMEDVLSIFIVDFLQVEGVKVFIKRDGNFVNIFNGNEKVFKDSRIKNLLNKNDIVLIDHLKREPVYKEVVKEIEKLDLFLIIPLYFKEQIIGFWGCGRKKSGETFFSNEINFLERISMHLIGKIESLNLSRELIETKIYQETILENLTDGIICLNEKGKITVCNKEATEILNKNKKEIIGNDYSTLPSFLREKFDALKKGGNVRSEEIVIVEEGKKRFFSITGSIFMIEENKKNYLLRISDITLIKQLEEEVRRAEKLASLGVMASGLAHELKNPLVSIRTFSQLLPTKFDDPEFREKFSQVIMEEADRINSLIEQVLQFSKPQIGEIREIDIIEILKSTVLMVRRSTKKEVEISENYPKRTIKIMGDPDKIKQVFLNVLINALDAVEDGGRIDINFEEENGWLKISIKDNGCGIKEENLNKVFDPFFTTKENGTGLGLSIVARIIDELKGRIRISSEEGKGTEVMLYFKMVNGGEK